MKKIIYAMLCLFIVFCLVGCNDKKDNDKTEEPIQLKAPLLKIEGTKVTWTPILHADSYVVYDEFRGGDDIYTYGLGTQTENSYEIILMGKGTYTVKVQAISNDHTKYTDSELSEPVNYECTAFGEMKLDAPVLTLTDNVVSWTAVSQADAYVVNVNGTDLESQTTLSYTITSTEAEENVVVKVKAIVYNQDLYDIENSDYSLPVTYEVVKPTPIPTPVELSAPSITLSENIVSWQGVDNADGYIVNLNGTDLEEQTETTYTINPSEEGEYEVVVRAVSHDTTHFTNSSTSNKVTYHYEVPFEKVPATLFVVGDSTLASFADSYFYPRYGYGTQLGNYFDEAITVNNLALSGRSSKSFITEDNYTALKNTLKAGDYLLIGFGHNDEKSDDAARFTDASKPLTDSGSFKYSLYEYYIKLAIEKGATPILCTPIVRADKNNIYTASSGHVTSTGDYAQAIVELGQEKNVTVINYNPGPAPQTKGQGGLPGGGVKK
ncbi:MAG: hypothetical protein K2N65_05685, partial [Anaeroplasmataceae bacterium]|nr:hypothetical protein [Anaeroplasmataceae bacterium]